MQIFEKTIQHCVIFSKRNARYQCRFAVDAQRKATKAIPEQV